MRTLLAPCWLLFLGCTAVLHGAHAAGGPDASRAAAPLAEAALERLAGTAAVGVLRHGSMQVAVRGASPAAAGEPVFEIGSISKVFTGLLLAQAVESGELRLEQTIGDLLGPSVRFDSRRTRAITLGQLVTHTACLPNFPENPNLVPAASQVQSYERAELWRALGKVTLAASAPCASQYSNFGFAILGELLAQRAGRPWQELVRMRITGPLGMTDTAVELPPARLVAGFLRDVPARHWVVHAFAGAGGLRSTAKDLLVFSKALIEGPQGPLGPAAKRMVTALAPYGTRGARIGYAVFLPQAPLRVWAHNGITGGHVAEWMVWPTRGEAVVILVSNLASPARGIARSMVQDTK
ncbi:MAG: serine hydrolase domain-containing protein [Ramlibacter sp.]